MWRSAVSRALRTVFAVAAVVAALPDAAPTWDLTRPVTDLLPEPIGITPTAPPEPERPEASQPSFEERVMELVNQERWANGQLPPLKQNHLLDSSAEAHSTNMADRDFVMHCDPDTLTLPWDRMVAAGYFYTSAGENIAWGYPNPEAVVTGWMNSAGHRANILSTSFRELGNGFVEQPDDLGNVRRSSAGGTSCTPNIFNEGPFFRYWTQNFGRRSGVYPLVIDREAFRTESRDVALYLWGSWSEMRLRNEGGVWSDWTPFTNDTGWRLSAGNGIKTVHAEMRSGSTVVEASDSILLEDLGEILFIDGFESGSTAAWSDVQP